MKKIYVSLLETMTHVERTLTGLESERPVPYYLLCRICEDIPGPTQHEGTVSFEGRRKNKEPYTPYEGLLSETFLTPKLSVGEPEDHR